MSPYRKATQNPEEGGFRTTRTLSPPWPRPKNTIGSQVTWLRGNDQDREAEAPEAPLPEVSADATVIHVEPLRWSGRGNVISAAGVAILDLLERA